MEQRGEPEGARPVSDKIQHLSQSPSRTLGQNACRPAFAGRHAFCVLQVCRSVLIFVVEISGVRGR